MNVSITEATPGEEEAGLTTERHPLLWSNQVSLHIEY